MVNSRYVTVLDTYENEKLLLWITVTILPLLVYIIGPYLAGRFQLPRRGYTGNFGQYMKAFYSGILYEEIPDYKDVCHHKDFSSNNVSCLISFMKNNMKAEEFKKSHDQSNTQWTLLLNAVHQSPKRNHVRLVILGVVILFIAQTLLFIQIAIILKLNPDKTMLSLGIASFIPILGIKSFLIYLSRKKLREKGYSKPMRVKGWIFFYTGAYFLPLPRHEEIATLPDFEEDNIYSLIDIQFRMYEAKKK